MLSQFSLSTAVCERSFWDRLECSHKTSGTANKVEREVLDENPWTQSTAVEIAQGVDYGEMTN
jgi:hypothetical protein